MRCIEDPSLLACVRMRNLVYAVAGVGEHVSTRRQRYVLRCCGRRQAGGECGRMEIRELTASNPIRRLRCGWGV